MLITIGFLLVAPFEKATHYLCDTRFQRHFSKYERVASEIESNATPDYGLKKSCWKMSLSYAPPVVYREKDGSLTIEFFVGGVGLPTRHVVYLYRSKGIIEKDSHTSQRCRHTAQIKDHWFRGWG
jgi:hypothetical protein